MKVKLILERKTFEMQLKGEVYRKVVEVEIPDTDNSQAEEKGVWQIVGYVEGDKKMTKLSMSEEEMLKRKYTRPYEKRIEELERKLEQTKEILSKLLEEEKNNMYWEMNGADKSSYYAVRKQAEQLLKEIK